MRRSARHLRAIGRISTIGFGGRAGAGRPMKERPDGEDHGIRASRSGRERNRLKCLNPVTRQELNLTKWLESIG